MREVDIVGLVGDGTIRHPLFVISDDFYSSCVWNARQLQRKIYCKQYNEVSFYLDCESLSWNFFL